MNQETAEAINKLGAFYGKRDVAEFTRECLMEKFGIAQADVMVLFGGSILAGGDLIAEAMKQRVAKKYLIVGGEGHMRTKKQKEEGTGRRCRRSAGRTTEILKKVKRWYDGYLLKNGMNGLHFRENRKES